MKEKKDRVESIKKRMAQKFDKLEGFAKAQIEKEGEINVDKLDSKMTRIMEEMEDRIEDRQLESMRELLRKKKAGLI